MAIGTVLKSDDLEKIAALLSDNGYKDSNITIVINARTKDILDRVNEDFFYRNNQEGTPPDVNEVNVDINGIHFKYVVEEDS